MEKQFLQIITNTLWEKNPGMPHTHYSKNKSLKIEEDFERILCYTDTPDDIDRYHFNVTHPLTLDIVQNRLELTSYMLYPCRNISVKKIGADGKETVVARYSNMQPLSRYVVLKNVDLNASYTVTADDEFYRSLNEIPVNWEISFSQVRANFGPGSWLILRAPVCREWISLITQMAYVLGALDARVNAEVVGMGSVGGSLLGLDEPYIGSHYDDKHILSTMIFK